MGNPTDGVIFRPGGDLLMRDLSSPSAQEMNITGDYTQGQGDVSDPEVSYDGTRIVFSMRGPNDSTWNVWEYEVETAALRRIVSDDALANAGDDVDPAYLPDGRIVFSSNRQEKSRQVLQQKGVEPYAHLDEYERERAILLHVMNSDGTEINRSRLTRAMTVTRPCCPPARSCLRAGTTSVTATISRSSSPIRTAPTSSSSTARSAPVTASCIRARCLTAV